MAQVLTETKKPAEELRHWKMSFEEFLHWDGDGNPDRRVEWVNGEAVEMIYVTAKHAQIVSFLFTLLGFACAAKGIGSVYGEPFVMRLTGGNSGRSPDLMVLHSANVDRVQERFLDGPADIVIEVVSPGSITSDYIVKLAEYRRAGVPEYWIVDPVGGQTSFLVLGDDREYHEQVLDGEGLFASRGLDGLRIDPGWFHQMELPNVVGILKGWDLV